MPTLLFPADLNNDQPLQLIQQMLQRYEADHPKSACEFYRHNSVAVRVRIVDERFQHLSLKQRQSLLEQEYLDALPEEVQTDITMLLLLSPHETTSAKMPLINLEFESPARAVL